MENTSFNNTKTSIDSDLNKLKPRDHLKNIKNKFSFDAKSPRTLIDN